MGHRRCKRAADTFTSTENLLRGRVRSRVAASREHDSDGMMLHQAQAQAQLQLEGGGSCILPSLSNVLLSMRTPKNGDEASAAAAQREMWTHVQQLNAQLSAQHMNMWGASSLLALSQAHSKASARTHAHGESQSTTDSGPASPGENTSEDEKPDGRHVAPGGKSFEASKAAALSKASATSAAARRDAQAGEDKTEAAAGSSQYWPGRRWRERRDKKYDGGRDTRQTAHLRVAVLGLHKALDVSGKAKLLVAMRQYLEGELTPDRFAEAIKDLVDQHNVVVPTGMTPPPMDTASRKRTLSSEKAADSAPAASCSSARPGRSRDGKRARTRATPSNRSASAPASISPAPGLVAEESEEGDSTGAHTRGNAWEALVSVCSML